MDDQDKRAIVAAFLAGRPFPAWCWRWDGECYSTNLVVMLSRCLLLHLSSRLREIVRMRTLFLMIAMLCAAAALLIGNQAAAQAPEGINIKATTLGTSDSPPGYETVMLIAELAPNTCSGRLTHPGVETSYILEGDFTLKIDGQPDKRLRGGDPFQVPAGVVHDACTNNGAKALVVFVVEKGKPRASPAP
jgi:quercetin dioxygenase-like cupin family protein